MSAKKRTIKMNSKKSDNTAIRRLKVCRMAQNQKRMNQQDFDKKKSIPQGKENSLFYKIINRMIISRKALGITHLVYGAIVLCVFAERAEILSSPPSVGSRIFLLLSICFPFVYGTYLLCTKDRNKSERS